jgi:hypothetical protein
VKRSLTLAYRISFSGHGRSANLLLGAILLHLLSGHTNMGSRTDICPKIPAKRLALAVMPHRGRAHFLLPKQAARELAQFPLRMRRHVPGRLRPLAEFPTQRLYPPILLPERWSP